MPLLWDVMSLYPCVRIPMCAVVYEGGSRVGV